MKLLLRKNTSMNYDIYEETLNRLWQQVEKAVAVKDIRASLVALYKIKWWNRKNQPQTIQMFPDEEK